MACLFPSILCPRYAYVTVRHSFASLFEKRQELISFCIRILTLQGGGLFIMEFAPSDFSNICQLILQKTICKFQICKMIVTCDVSATAVTICCQGNNYISSYTGAPLTWLGICILTKINLGPQRIVVFFFFKK